MSKLTLDTLESFRISGSVPKHWIRVGMDTGGIAAGAREVYDALMQTKDEAGLDVEIPP